MRQATSTLQMRQSRKDMGADGGSSDERSILFYRVCADKRSERVALELPTYKCLSVKCGLETSQRVTCPKSVRP